MSTDRRAKLPPDLDDVIRLQKYRAMVMEIAEAAMGIIRVAAPAAQLEAEARARAIAKAAAAAAEAEPPPPRPAAPPPTDPQPAESAPPAAPQKHPYGPRNLSPATLFIRCARIVTSCINLDARLAQAQANAHTTAEQAGLLHPYREPVLDYLHRAVGQSEPVQFRSSNHNDIAIRVTEHLGFLPDTHPPDLITEICSIYGLKNDPEAYPEPWRQVCQPPPPDPPTPSASPPAKPPARHPPPDQPPSLWASILAETTAHQAL